MELRELAERIVKLVLKSEDDYEATYDVEDEIKKYLSRNLVDEMGDEVLDLNTIEEYRNKKR